MMGRQRRDQDRLFYEFRLEDRIPENHLLRRINVFVTVALEGLHKELEPHYSEFGRPSVDGPHILDSESAAAWMPAQCRFVTHAKQQRECAKAGLFNRLVDTGKERASRKTRCRHKIAA